MSVRVRLTRVGSKKNPIWRVVVADQRSPRDGRFIETVGQYNPQTDPSTIVLDEERLQHWIARGAQPTGTVKQLMKAYAKGPHEAPAPAEPEVAAATATAADDSQAATAEAEAPAESAAGAPSDLGATDESGAESDLPDAQAAADAEAAGDADAGDGADGGAADQGADGTDAAES